MCRRQLWILSQNPAKTDLSLPMISLINLPVAFLQEGCERGGQRFLLCLDPSAQADTYQANTQPSKIMDSFPFQLASLRRLDSGFDTNLDRVTNLVVRPGRIDFNEAAALLLAAKQGCEVAELLHVF